MTRAKNKFLVVFNPLFHRKRKYILSRLVARMREQNLDWDLYPTSADYAANAHFFAQNLDMYSDLILVGGDGTFNQLVNFIQGRSIRVGLLPAGTGNDFARAWYGKKRNDLDHLLDVVLSRDVTKINLGKCEFKNPALSESKQPIRYFHNVLGTGFDSSLAKALRHNKGMFKSLSYWSAALRNIPFYREKTIHLRSQSGVKTYQNLITAFANSRYFGGGMDIAPHADPKTSMMDLVSVGQHSLLVKLGLIGLLSMGKHQGSRHVCYETLEEAITIETQGLDLQADGEFIGQSPCVISITTQGIWLKY